jgi:hypothetical protein
MGTNFKNNLQMMKNIKRFSALTLIGLFLVTFSSCEDTSELFTISAPTAPVLAELSFTDLELDANNTNNPAIVLNWNDAEYGLQTATNYAIQFASDDAFTSPVTAATVSGRNSVTLSVNEVNAAAGNAGLNPFEWKPVFIRIVSSLGTKNGVAVNSNAIQINVYPYFNYVFDDYFLVGNGVASGWDNNNSDLAYQNTPLFRDEADSNVFYYTGYFQNNSSDYNEGRFKVLETKGLWQPQWGVVEPEGSDDFKTAGDIAGNPTTQSGDPGRFGVENSGFYSFKIDFSTNKYTMVPFNATGISSPTSLTLKGSSTADLTMTPLAFDGHLWYATNVTLTPGSVEFVTDAGSNWGSSTSFSGVAAAGGGAIPVIVEANYDVWFNDLTGRYIFIPLTL